MIKKTHSFSAFKKFRLTNKIGAADPLPDGEHYYDFTGVEIGDAVSFFGSPLVKQGEVLHRLWTAIYSAAVFAHARKLGEGSGPKVYLVQTNVLKYIMVYFGEDALPKEFAGRRMFDMEPHEIEYGEKTVPCNVTVNKSV